MSARTAPLLISLVAAIAPTVAAACSDPPPLPVHGEVPELALTDQHGHAFTDADLRGKVSVVDFIFTSCPSICPLLTQKLGEVAHRYEDDDAVQLVSISVDPEHDTPDVLRAYAASHHAASARWRFVTGDARDISRVVMRGFHQALGEPVPADNGRYDIAHSSRFVLVDARARIRGYYRNDADGMTHLLEDIDRLRADLRAEL